ncbi:hypothetical protein Trydic_g6216 [Trypoxylus dichotomus]
MIDRLKQIILKDVVYGIADAWNKEDILDEENVDDDHDTMFELLQKLPDCENDIKEDFIGWLDGDEREKLTESGILNLVTMDTMEEDDINDEIAELHKMS